MRYTDGYEVETEEGPAYVRPLDIMLKQAIETVPRELWQPCPKCGQKCPLMFGVQNGPGKSDPYGMREYHCAICQLELELGLDDTK